MNQVQQAEPPKPKNEPFRKSVFVVLQSRIAQYGQKLLGYLYLAYWWIQYAFRLRVAPKFAYVVATLSGYEILDSILHQVVDRLHDKGNPLAVKVVTWIANHQIRFLDSDSRVLFWASIIAIPVTVLMVYHHHRIQRRVERHDILLSSLRDVTDEASKIATLSHTDMAEKDFLRRVLQALTFSLEKHNSYKPLISATILWRSSEAEGFKLLKQFPDDMYVFPPEGLPPRSAADAAVDPQSRGIIYVPWTKFQNGVRVATVESVTPRYSQMDLLDDVFKPMNMENQPVCHASIEISTGDKNTQYVLCLDANKRSCMGSLEFRALEVVASIIGLVLVSPNRKLTFPSQERPRADSSI